MIGMGTIVNCMAIVAGGSAGTLIKTGLPQRLKDTVMQAIGLAVLVIGLSGTLQGLYRVSGDSLDRQYIMIMIFSLVIGGITGEICNIEGGLEKAGDWFQKKFAKGDSTFAEGFVTSSLIYCVGAMAIIGSLEDGLSGNPGTLYAKAVLDGVSAIIFAATMGIGVAFSFIPVLLYQGSITLLADLIRPYLTDIVISQVSLTGSVLIMGIGFNLLGIAKIKVGNLLPAIFIPFIYFLIQRLF